MLQPEADETVFSASLAQCLLQCGVKTSSLKGTVWYGTSEIGSKARRCRFRIVDFCLTRSTHLHIVNSGAVVSSARVFGIKDLMSFARGATAAAGQCWAQVFFFDSTLSRRVCHLLNSGHQVFGLSGTIRDAGEFSHGPVHGKP